MSDRYIQYRILYSLYDNYYSGQPYGVDIKNLLQDESLGYIHQTILVGEIMYLEDSKLLERKRVSHGVDAIIQVKITAKGIDIVNEILDMYHKYLENKEHMDLQGAYNNISAIPDLLGKRRATNFYIRKRSDLFRNFLRTTNIFAKLLIPNYIQRHTDIDKSIIAEHVMYLSSLYVIDRIRKLEDKHMERKSSFRYDPSTARARKDREKQVSKSIAGFMNAEGGILYIGVDNKGNVVGLKNDYSLVKDKNADGFQLELRNSINHFLKKKMISGLIDIKFHPLNGEEICEIVVKASPEPIILYDNTKEEFYVREGNSTKPYSLTQAIEYRIEHFTTQNGY
jgi:hypothetical protein